ncbi:MAG: 50S ribosomal protein L18 [Clostridia bacterium]|nr:50S ribosomal protein L18 [Clostridia bacterium]
MVSKPSSNKARLKRHGRIRQHISGTQQRPRLCVFRSLKNIYVQVIDDVKGVTLVSASSLELKDTYGGNKSAAKEVGKLIAQKATEKGISEVIFDRGGYIYHGRVAELAAGAREGGLKF